VENEVNLSKIYGLGTGLGNNDQKKIREGPVNAYDLTFWAGVKISDVEVCAGYVEPRC